MKLDYGVLVINLIKMLSFMLHVIVQQNIIKIVKIICFYIRWTIDWFYYDINASFREPKKIYY